MVLERGQEVEVVKVSDITRSFGVVPGDIGRFVGVNGPHLFNFVFHWGTPREIILTLPQDWFKLRE